MTIYNINRGIGWASSGVEYAQAYRASILRNIHQDSKFIFTDMFQGENLAHYTANIGFQDEEVVWLYGFFTDVKTRSTTYTIGQFESSLSSGMVKISQNNDSIRYEDKEKGIVAIGFLRKDHPDYVQRVEYLSKGKLIRKDYFSYTKMFSEYYAPVDNQPKLYQRTFFNEDGSVAYEENCDGEKSLFRFKDTILFSKEELIGYMLDCLQLTSQDIILVDRATGTGQAILHHKGAAKVAVVIHAEHYNINSMTEDTILWNNYYEYQFTNADKIDAFITSTQAQKDTLSAQFKKYTNLEPAIFVLPVGSLDKLRHSAEGRCPFSLLTCSRLAAEKHIDWLVEGVVLAQKQLPDLTFDIYGAGGQQSKLASMIEQHQAQSYIHLKGHHDLTDIYQQYQVYLTASTSEGFGLTLMEAIGSGLPIIGLDVPYGNQTFVENEKNGYLIPRQDPDDAIIYAQEFAKRLIQLYQSNQLDAWHQASYERAEEFLTSRLEEAWQTFIEEV
ncbi:TPA: accessory Sec system glycosyltransferase GtfA [Streptococcus suis]